MLPVLLFFVIPVVANAMDATLPVSLPRNEFLLPVLIFTAFVLGMGFLSLSLVLPPVPGPYNWVGLDGAWEHAIGQRNQRHVASQKGIFQVAVLLVMVPAVGIAGDLPVDLSLDPYHEFLLSAYAFVNFAIFIMGMGLLMLSLVLPRVPTVMVAMAKKLMWVAVALVHVALSLKLTIHAVY